MAHRQRWKRQLHKTGSIGVYWVGLLAILASVLVAAIWFGLFRSRAALPSYRGKTAHEWFFGVDGHPGREETINAAREAFDAMGTNCVPCLLDRVRRRETVWKKFYCWIYPSFPSMLRSKLRPPLRPYYTQKIALWHLEQMKPKLDYAASDLMAIVPEIADDKTREQAYFTVESLAERIHDVRKKKAYFLGFLGDPDFRIQLRSAIMLARLDSSLTNGIPILINAVTNKSLMNSTFPPTIQRGIPSQAPIMQRMAYEALSTVVPSLADNYRIAK